MIRDYGVSTTGPVIRCVINVRCEWIVYSGDEVVSFESGTMNRRDGCNNLDAKFAIILIPFVDEIRWKSRVMRRRKNNVLSAICLYGNG